MAIDHDELNIMHTIERYLRGELTPEEEQEWEEHYFQCEQCFKGLEATAQIREFVKGGAIRQPAEKCRARARFRLGAITRSFRDWLLPSPAWQPAFAWATIALIVGIVAVVGWMRVATLSQEVHGLRMPGSAILSYVLNEGVRGEASPVEIPADGGRFLLQFNLISQQAESTIHTARIQDVHGTVIWTGTDVRGEGRYGTFVIACHSSFFAPGDYELHVDEVRADNGVVIDSAVFPFRINEAAPSGTQQ